MPVPKEKLDNIVKSCDIDGDGNISYSEFVDGYRVTLSRPTRSGQMSHRALVAAGKLMPLCRMWTEWDHCLVCFCLPTPAHPTAD